MWQTFRKVGIPGSSDLIGTKSDETSDYSKEQDQQQHKKLEHGRYVLQKKMFSQLHS